MLMTRTNLEGDALVRACNGESSAVGELVDGLRHRIARLAAYYASRCPEEAGDLEQEAWVAVLEAIPRLRLGVGEPRQYLVKMARWRILNYINEQASRRHDELPEDYDEPVPSRAQAEAAVRGALVRLFELLTDRQATILRALLSGHTSAEVARLLECSTANVAWHVARIRAAYREAIAG